MFSIDGLHNLILLACMADGSAIAAVAGLIGIAIGYAAAALRKR